MDIITTLWLYIFLLIMIPVCGCIALLYLLRRNAVRNREASGEFVKRVIAGITGGLTVFLGIQLLPIFEKTGYSVASLPSVAMIIFLIFFIFLIGFSVYAWVHDTSRR